MTKFHINPNTGNPNVCPDKLKCKFTSEEGVVPPHYATKDEAKKAVEDQIFTAFSAPETSSADTETANDAPEPVPASTVKSSSADEPRGPECFENAVKVARKTVIDLVRKKRIARVQLKKLKKKVKKKARKLKAIRSKIKKQS